MQATGQLVPTEIIPVSVVEIVIKIAYTIREMQDNGCNKKIG